MRINISTEGLADVKKVLAGLVGAEKDRALQMAINKTTQKGRAEVNRAVLEKYAITASDVQNSVIVSPAHKMQAVAMATISIFGSPSRRGRSMNMIRFLATFAGRSTRSGKAKAREIKALGERLGFRITKTGGLKSIAGAFVGNKGRTVFNRVEGKYMGSRTGATKHSQQIAPVQVIGVSQMFNSRMIRGRVMAKISDDFEIELGRAVSALIARRK